MLSDNVKNNFTLMQFEFEKINEFRWTLTFASREYQSIFLVYFLFFENGFSLIRIWATSDGEKI
jgi:hypothetical protein